MDSSLSLMVRRLRLPRVGKAVEVAGLREVRGAAGNRPRQTRHLVAARQERAARVLPQVEAAVRAA
jgi:hypothetical protein